MEDGCKEGGAHGRKDHGEMERRGCACCQCGTDGGHEDDAEEGASLKEIIAAAALFALGIAAGFLSERSAVPILSQEISLGAEAVPLGQTLAVLLHLAAYLFCGRKVVAAAARNLLKGSLFDEQFLMSVASLGAVAIGEFPEAVAVMLFYQVGEYFQNYALGKSRGSITALMAIRPDKATVLRGGAEAEVAPEDVRPGETVVVKPGERIPVDGVISKGRTFLDNSALTGESVPVEAREGGEVFSGAINTLAAIEIRAVRPAAESAAARILTLVEESSSKKTRTERFIRRFSKIYTPSVCAAALLIATVPPLFLGGWNGWIYRALIFLVVSCPCALVISVPLTFFGGIGAASRQGILVKGSGSIEALARADTAVFDKTGTLTKGVFAVSGIHCARPDAISEDALLAIAAHAEQYSNHPVSKSLRNAHHAECCESAVVQNAQEISGRGIRVELNGTTVLAGNERLMTESAVAGCVPCEREDAGTIVHVAVGGEYAGHIVIADEAKGDAREAVQRLRRLGVKNIVMLTGDTRPAAEAAARALGIESFFPQLLPGDKVEKVESLMAGLSSCGARRGTLIFAGDGINDAPVLARADVGIAMGGLGSDAAIESADVVIMTDEPSKIADAVHISRRIMGIVRENIAFSLSVKAAMMALGALGIANIWTAVFGDVGVMLLAILNSMRMLLPQKKMRQNALS